MKTAKVAHVAPLKQSTLGGSVTFTASKGNLVDFPRKLAPGKPSILAPPKEIVESERPPITEGMLHWKWTRMYA
jgi:hypothetical protein